MMDIDPEEEIMAQSLEDQVAAHLSLCNTWLEKIEVRNNTIPGLEVFIRITRDILIQQKEVLANVRREQAQEAEWVRNNVAEQKGVRNDLSAVSIRVTQMERDIGAMSDTVLNQNQKIRALEGRIKTLENQEDQA